MSSADLKIDRAAKHIGQLNDLFQKRRPFSYILETNTETGERATFAKKNESVVQEAALICGDVVHNLRSALDHAYWDRVSYVATTDRERRAVQFPFCKEAARLDEAVKNRLADRVSPEFFKAMLDLKPHGEPGGNELLYLIDQLDVIDKHKLLIPTGDYTRLSSDTLIKQVPDFPRGLINCSFGQNRRDVAWRVNLSRETRRKYGGRVLEQELNVPVEIVFAVGEGINPRPVVPTLHKLVDVARITINIIRTA